MTVINPNSVAGINSITVQSGNSLSVHKANGELIRTITEESGISTFTSVSVGSATTDNSAAKSINIGLGASISQHTDNTLTFGTAGDPVAKFDASGQLLLGTGTARQKLHINASDSGAANMVFTNTTTGTSASDGFIVGISGAEDAQINMQESANLKFSTADTERFRIDSNGRLIIGHTASTGEARYFQIVGTTADTASAQLIRHSADANASKIDFTKSRNATKGSNTIVQDDDVLGSIEFRGDDGTDLNSTGASISASVDGTPGSNDMPGRLVFSTTADGSSSATERLRITSSGQVGIASATPTSGFTLDVGGDATIGTPKGNGNTFLDQKQDGDLHLINSGRTANGASGSPGTAGVGINRFNTRAGGTSLFRDFCVYNGKDSKVLVVDGSASAVGVGTDAPATSLDVRGDVAVDYNATHALRFYTQPRNNWSSISNTATDSNANLSFKSSQGEAMHITYSKLVGFGTNDPQQGLHLHTTGSSAANMVFSNTTTGSGGSDGFIVGLDGAERGQIFNQENTDLIFGTNNLERLRVTSDGDILIGNTLGGAEAVNMVGGGGGILISRSESGSPSDGQTLADLGLNSYASGQTCSSADVLIRGQADGDHSGSAAGSALLLFTKPSSTGPGSSPTERLRINKSGAIGIAGANYGSAGQVLTSNGSGSAVSWAAASGGKVLQVVSQTKTDTASNSTGSGASDVWNYNVSDLRVQITAANANNKFLIMGSVTTASSASVHVIVRDDGTNLVGLQATSQSQRRQASSGHDQSDSHSASTVPILGMITAGDTNQHTFHYAFNHTSGSTQTIFLNRGTNDGNGSDRGRYISTITVLEIEA